MEFEDAVLVRLADETTRPTLFDQASLASVIAAGYDLPELEGPYAALFDSVELAVDLSARVQVSGSVRRIDEALPYEIDLRAVGLRDDTPSVTALWRGAVTARVHPAGDPITSVTSNWRPDRGPDVAGDLRVVLADPVATSPQVRRLPITAVVLARGSGFRLTALLRETSIVRERLFEAGLEAPADPQLRRRQAVVVAWLLPTSIFDDAAWPVPDGTDPAHLPAARRANAGVWLARHGIALVPTTVS